MNTGRPVGYRCFFCKQSFQYGPRVFAGRPIRKWDLMICNGCYDAHRHGIATEQFPEVIAHLKSKRIPWRLNPKGLIDVPG
jgi:hypothetical protein